MKVKVGQTRQWQGLPKLFSNAHPAEGLMFTVTSVDQDDFTGHYVRDDDGAIFCTTAIDHVELYSIVLEDVLYGPIQE